MTHGNHAQCYLDHCLSPQKFQLNWSISLGFIAILLLAQGGSDTERDRERERQISIPRDHWSYGLPVRKYSFLFSMNISVILLVLYCLYSSKHEHGSDQAPKLDILHSASPSERYHRSTIEQSPTNRNPIGPTYIYRLVGSWSVRLSRSYVPCATYGSLGDSGGRGGEGYI